MTLPQKRNPHRFQHNALAIAAMLAAGQALAFEIESDNPDVKMRWDNTIKYSNAFRLKAPSAGLVADPNLDDGDRNFSKGLISNRVDLLSEFDVSYKGFGLRMSGAGWYDTVYNRRNDNDSPGTVNHASTAPGEFATGTRKVHGRDAELLDAFLFGKADLGDAKATFRLGQHALLYGESLFFGQNGIAGGQQPVDVVKILSVPNTQFKEFIRPVPQVSTLVQVSSNVAVGGYYQFRWKKNRIPASGSYFAFADPLDAGGELIVGPGFTRAADHEPPNSGQGGLQVKVRSDAIDTDFGFYAIRFHSRDPIVTVEPITHSYHADYGTGVKAFGVSASKTVENFNLAGEVSIRRNQPLSRGAPVVVGVGAPPSVSTSATGNTAHAQFSWLASLGPSPIARSADFLGEIAWHRVLSVTKNPEGLDPNAGRDAWGARVIYAPSYVQAVSGVDLSVPVGIGYTKGRSGVFGGTWGPDGGGDLSVGVNGTYLGRWKFGLNLTHYFGKEKPITDPSGSLNYGQYLKDRDFLSFTVSNTF